MLPEQRRQRILELVRESGGTTSAVLAKEFGISEATARRDLAALEGHGRVKRTHGGAVLPGLSQREDSFQHRLGEAVAAKKRLGRAALDLVGEGEAVFVDSSTTAYYAAQRMVGTLSRGAFLTNLVPVMDLFGSAESPDLSLIGLGGTFRPLTLSFVGPCAIRTIQAYFADRAFLSVWGISPKGYLTDANPLEAEVKRAMIQQAAKPVLLVDGRKFERRGLSVIAHVSEVSLVLTAEASLSHVRVVEDMGVSVQRV
jgi:DeoR/GlpR family transcriptional regulator of sugar metabolism